MGFCLFYKVGNECFVSFFFLVMGGEFLMIEVKSSWYPNCTDEFDDIYLEERERKNGVS